MSHWEATGTRARIRTWSARRTRPLGGGTTLVLVTAVVAPFVLFLVLSTTVAWYPSWDLAAMMLRSLDVGTVNTPLVGPYSRFGWNHPGPMLYLIFAPFVHILGPNGMLVGATAIGMSSIVYSVLVTSRHIGRIMAVPVSLCGLLLSLGLGQQTLVDPWNPTVVILPFFTFVISIFADLVDNNRGGVASVVFGSLAVQAHVGFLLPVLGLGLLAILVRLHSIRAQRFEETPPSSRIVRPAIVVGIALWALPLIDELRGNPGNLTRLVNFFVHRNDPTYGIAKGLKSVARELSPRLPWITGHDTTTEGTIASGSWTDVIIMFVLLACILWGAVHARRAGDRRLVTLSAISVTLISTGAVAMASAGDPPYVYFTYWIRVGAAVTWLTLFLILAYTARGQISVRFGAEVSKLIPRVAIPLACLAVLGFGTALAVEARGFEVPAAERGNAVIELVDTAAPSLDRDATYVVTWPIPNTFDPLSVTLLAKLESRGFHALFEQGTWIVGSHRVVTDADKDVIPLRIVALSSGCPAAPPQAWRTLACTSDAMAHAAARGYAVEIRDAAEFRRPSSSPRRTGQGSAPHNNPAG